MAYYLQFDGVDDYVSIDISTSSTAWTLEFKLNSASIADEFGTSRIFSSNISGTATTRCFLQNNNRFFYLVQNFALDWTGLAFSIDDIFRLEQGGSSTELFINNVSQGAKTNGLSTISIPFLGGSGGFSSQTAFEYIKFIDPSTPANDRNYNPSSSNGTGSILPDDIGGNNGTLVNFPVDDSQWVFYTPPVLGSHYLAFDGVNDWIRMANFTMPSTGIFSYSIDLQAYLSANTGAGVLLQFGSFSRLLMSIYTDTGRVLFDLLRYDGAREFTVIDVDFTEKLVINIEIDFDLNELRFYINNALISTNTTFDFLAAYAGQVSTQNDFGNEFNNRFLKCDLYEININNQLLYKNDESNELTYFPEIIQGAHATMFNFTLPDAWVFYSSGVQIAGAFNMPFLSVLSNGSVTLPQPIANCEFEMPFLSVGGNISVTLPQPIIDGAFSMPFLGVNGSIQVGEITFTIERETNINQKYLSANINQKYLNNNITYN